MKIKEEIELFLLNYQLDQKINSQLEELSESLTTHVENSIPL